MLNKANTNYIKENLIDIIKNLPEIVAAVFLAFVTVLIIVAVVFRYILNAPITWYEELCRVLFIWIAFFGAAIGVKRNAHFGIMIFIEKMPIKMRHLTSIVSEIVSILVCAVLVYSSYRITAMAFKHTFHQLQIPVGWLHIAVTISALLMAIYSTSHLVQSVKGKEIEKEEVDILA